MLSIDEMIITAYKNQKDWLLGVNETVDNHLELMD